MSAIITPKRAALIQRGALLANEIKALELQLDLVKDALQTLSPGKYVIEGADDLLAEVLIKEGSRTTLDSKTVKGFLTPAQLAAASKTTAFRSCSFTARIAAAEKVAA